MSFWQKSKNTHPGNEGFVLPLVIALGLATIILGLTATLIVQTNRTTQSARRHFGASLAVAEAGADRLMLELSRRHNTILLGRNYDPINPKTGRNYLGPDRIPNSGDESQYSLDEWIGFNPSPHPCFAQAGVGPPTMTLTGDLGENTSFTLLAYRYDPNRQIGTLLVQGSHRGIASTLSLEINVAPELTDFPGVIAFNPLFEFAQAWPAGAIALRGRQVLGSKGNLYYNPVASANTALTDVAAPNSPLRPNYLDANWSSSATDGAAGDTVQGKLFACNLFPHIPDGIRGTNFGVINASHTFNGNAGSWTAYQVEAIDLAGTDVLTVDTTQGPVRIDIIEPATPDVAITLRDSAKIVNIRTDGQPPRVGDLRILARGNSKVVLHGQSCMQNLFLWLQMDEFVLLTTGPGCPSGQNTNFEGVLWVEALLSSKNNAANRDATYLDGTWNQHNITTTPGATSGIYVSEDVSSLTDLLQYMAWPVYYRFNGITSWNQVRI